MSLLTGAIHLCGEGAIKEAVDLRLQLAIVEWPRVGNARGSDLGMNMPLPPGCRQRQITCRQCSPVMLERLKARSAQRRAPQQDGRGL